MKTTLILEEVLDLILEEVLDERKSQDMTWGEQNHNPEYWLAILTEELGEVAKEICDVKLPNNSRPYMQNVIFENLRQELIQVAAVAVAFIESLDRNELK